MSCLIVSIADRLVVSGIPIFLNRLGVCEGQQPRWRWIHIFLACHAAQIIHANLTNVLDLQSYIPRLETCSQKLNIGKLPWRRTFRQFTPMLSETDSLQNALVYVSTRTPTYIDHIKVLSLKISHRNGVIVKCSMI